MAAQKQKKQSLKSTLGGLLTDVLESSLQSLLVIIIQNAEHIKEWITSLAIYRKKLRKIAVSFVFLMAGITVMGMGLAIYIASLAPDLTPGLAHIWVGLAMLVVALVYSKVHE